MKKEKMDDNLSKHLIALKQKYKDVEITNAFKNYKTITDELNLDQRKFNKYNISNFSKVRNISEIQRKDEPVILVGSGFSLNNAITDLMMWQHDIIISTSQFTTFVYHEIEPVFTVSVDPFSFKEEFFIDSWKTKYNFVLPVTFDSEAIQFLLEKNQIIYAYKRTGEEYLDIINIGYKNFIMPNYVDYTLEDTIDTEIESSLHSMVFQIKLAELIGYDPIILIGSDLVILRADRWYCEKEKKKLVWKCDRATNQTHGQSSICYKEWIKLNKKIVSEYEEYNGKTTTNLLIRAKHEIDNAIHGCKTEIIDCSDGILECKKGNLKDMIRRYS